MAGGWILSNCVYRRDPPAWWRRWLIRLAGYDWRRLDDDYEWRRL